jgi:hypothetical protein
MKKLLSLLLATIVLLATQVSTPAFAAAEGQTTHKIDGHLLYGNYDYPNIHIEDGKLIAKGDWMVHGSPTGCTIEFQLVRPLSFDRYSFNADGTISAVKIEDVIWTLPEALSVVRSEAVTPVDGDKSISFELSLLGLPDGLYRLQELTIKGNHQEGSITDQMYLIVYNGVPSLQQTSYPFPQFTGFWSNDKTYIGD